MCPLRPIKLFVYACMGIVVGMLFATIQSMVLDVHESQRIAVMIGVVLSYAYMVKTLGTSLWRGEYYEPYEHAIGLGFMGLSHFVVYGMLT